MVILLERLYYSGIPLVLRSLRRIHSKRYFQYSTTAMSLKSDLEKAKELAAFQAVDEHVKNNQVIGIGSGSTVVYAVARIAHRVKTENLELICIPTSFQAKNLIIDNNLKLSDLDSHPKIDLTIDGCDECDADLNLIKGGGGCHLQEKIVASASDKLVIIADHTKDSHFLGEKWKKGIPLEVSQIGCRVVLNKLRMLGKSLGSECSSETTGLRLAAKKMGPVVTDGGNFIVDFQIGNILQSQNSYSPKTLDALLRTIPGVLETGIFAGMARNVFFGNADGTVTTRSSNT